MKTFVKDFFSLAFLNKGFFKACSWYVMFFRLYKKIFFQTISIAFFGLWILTTQEAIAGTQKYEPLSIAMQTALRRAIRSSEEIPEPRFESMREKIDWLVEMSSQLPIRWKPTYQQRIDFLRTVRYESQRSGLDPHLVLAIIEVESYFRKYAISRSGARGYMQVMPFWTKVIGDGDASRLFEMKTNLRYGCTILRHYLDLENGDLFRALGRYNGSLGHPGYPNAVLKALKKWTPKNSTRLYAQF